MGVMKLQLGFPYKLLKKAIKASIKKIDLGRIEVPNFSDAMFCNFLYD